MWGVFNGLKLVTSENIPISTLIIFIIKTNQNILPLVLVWDGCYIEPSDISVKYGTYVLKVYTTLKYIQFSVHKRCIFNQIFINWFIATMPDCTL